MNSKELRHMIKLIDLARQDKHLGPEVGKVVMEIISSLLELDERLKRVEEQLKGEF